MSEDWLQLSDADIDRTRSLARSGAEFMEPLIIGEEDMPPLESSEQTALLKITDNDLLALEPDPKRDDTISQLERLMFRLTNEARRHALPRFLGSAELSWHRNVAEAAREHSTDMLRRHYVSHTAPEGTSAARRIDSKGVAYLACGENIGVYYGDVAESESAIREIHLAFLNQPIRLNNHRANILNPLWTHAGIGVAVNPKGTLVVTQKFLSAPFSGRSVGRRRKGEQQ